MRISKLRWKNFTSWGNSWQELDFNKAPGLSLVSGKNGAGKSSLSNVIIYMLYGQLDDFTQKDIPNHINKNFEGEIFFSTSNHDVYIYRALAPNGFKVILDNKPVDTAGKTNVQKWLEDEIYKIPYDIFKNSIILSVDDFKSFVDLSPKEKRDIIDKMFGYHIINTAFSKVKEKLKTVKNEILLNETNINGLNSSISEINENISKINSMVDDISGIEQEFSDLKLKIKNRAEEYKSAANDIEQLYSSINKKEKTISDLKYNLKDLNIKMNLYSNGVCPVCGASLETEEHKHIKHDLEKTKTEITEKISEEQKLLDYINTEYSNKSSVKKDLVNRINEMKIDYAKYDTIIKEHGKAKENHIANLESMKTSLLKKIEPKNVENSKLEKQLKVLNIISDIFSETGLKQYISDIYVPMINEYVNDACDKLGIPYRVTFTTGYDCEITFMGNIVKYKTLSRGERKKVDIAVTLAFLKIIKTKISDINILFLDEVLSGIDVSSCNDLLKIFSDFSKDSDLRIYMVHHANLDSTYVDENIEIEKQSGFSHFVKTI